MSEEPLRGGFVTPVVRVGDTVRRTPPRDPDFVRRLLYHFEQWAWPGAPRFLGMDEQGREVLSYLPGHVPWERAETGEAGLVRLAELVREFHDLTAGTALAGDAEVVCHNDLSPKNTVYRYGRDGLLPYAFIDWDIAAPGERIHDVAHVCWQHLGLGPAIADPAEAGRLMRVIADAYRLDGRDRLVDTVLWWQDRCQSGIESSDEPAMARLRDEGVPARIRADRDWTAEHHQTLDAALAPRKP